MDAGQASFKVRQSFEETSHFPEKIRISAARILSQYLLRGFSWLGLTHEFKI